MPEIVSNVTKSLESLILLCPRWQSLFHNASQQLQAYFLYLAAHANRLFKYMIHEEVFAIDATIDTSHKRETMQDGIRSGKFVRAIPLVKLHY